MKLPIHLLTLTAICIYFSQAVGQQKQPVTAYKTVDRTNEWTIGIYDANNQLVSEQIVFRLNTNFLSGKGKKLAFEWNRSPKYIYVYRGNVGQENLAERYAADSSSAYILRSEEITPEKAPAGSKIKITDSYVTIDKPKDTTRTITMYTTDEATNIVPLTLQAAKIPDVNASGNDLYGKPVKIEKHVPGKTYKLTIPQDKEFYLIRTPRGSLLKGGEATSMYVGLNDLNKNSELAIGYNIAAKQRSARKQMLQDTAYISIPLVKNCSTSVGNEDHCLEDDWTVKIHDAQGNYTGFSKVLGTPIRTPISQVSVPVHKPFWVYVSKPYNTEKGTFIERTSPITKNHVMKIDINGEATIVSIDAALNTINPLPRSATKPAAPAVREQEQYGGL